MAADTDSEPPHQGSSRTGNLYVYHSMCNQSTCFVASDEWTALCTRKIHLSRTATCTVCRKGKYCTEYAPKSLGYGHASCNPCLRYKTLGLRIDLILRIRVIYALLAFASRHYFPHISALLVPMHQFFSLRNAECDIRKRGSLTTEIRICSGQVLMVSLTSHSLHFI